MNHRDHEISPEQWIDFVEGNIDRVESARIEALIAACRECRAVHENLLWSGSLVEDIVSRGEAQLETSASALADIRRGVFARIRESQAHSARQAMTMGLDHLRAILEPICGAATTAGAMHRAARLCRAERADQITGLEWEPFAHHLGSIVDAICGVSAAQLVIEAARGIQTESGS